MTSGENRTRGGAGVASRCFSALDFPQFRIYLLGQMCSSAGTGLQTVAIAWLVWRLTHSAAALGALAACAVVPQILFSVLGGCLADRIERRRLMLSLQIVGLTLCSMIAVGLVPAHHCVGMVMAFAFLFGTYVALEYPARQAFAASVLPVDRLVSARGLYSFGCSIAMAMGSMLGGLLVDLAGEMGEISCVFANAVSYSVAGFMLWRIGRMAPAETVAAQKSEDSDKENAAKQPARHSVKDCLAFVGGSKAVAFTFVQTAVLVLFGLRYVALLPAMAQDIFHGAAGATGMLHAALCAGFSAASLLSGGLRGRHLLRYGTGALLLLPLFLVALSQSRNLSVGMVLVLALAFLQSANINASVVSMQLSSPDRIFGRLMGLRIAMAGLLELIGATCVGAMVGVVGLTNALVISAMGCLLLAVISWLAFSEESGLPVPAKVAVRLGLKNRRAG